MVSALGFGAMELRGSSHRLPRPIDDARAARVLTTVLDEGITFIDTSIDYGMSEDLIGTHIGHRREEFFIATKCGCPLDPTDAPADPETGLPRHDFGRENIVAGVDQSLRRLRTDRIDLLQLHGQISGRPSREDLERLDVPGTLNELKASGKVRFVGISSVLPHAADHVEMEVFDAFQLRYSALDRSHEEIIRRAGERGAAVVARGGVAKGVPGQGRASREVWSAWDQAGLDDVVGGITRMEAMIRFVLSEPAISTAIVGSANPDHVRQNAESARRGPLAADVVNELKRRLEDFAATRP